MPLRQSTDFSQRFYRQLEETREKIETLPNEWRSYFRSLADEAEAHHRSMDANCATVRDLVDDMRLNEASVKFDLWSASQNLSMVFAAGRNLGTPETRHGESLSHLPPTANSDRDAHH